MQGRGDRQDSSQGIDISAKLPYAPAMTNIQIALPDDLAREAAKAGFLANDRLAETLRAQIAAQAKLDALLLEGLDGEATPWTAGDAERLHQLALSGR